MKIATHDGYFHTDEVIGIAILKMIYPDMELIRSRNPEVYKKADIRVDVGQVYNPESGDFDHHQKEFNLKRKNGNPYASAGLIWKHYGMRLVKYPESFDHIDEKIMQPIDLGDVGVDSFKVTVALPYLFGTALGSFSKIWNSDEDQDENFMKAVNFAKEILSREIEVANARKEGEDALLSYVDDINTDYVVLGEPVPPFVTLLTKTNIKYAVYKYNSKFWGIKAVRKSPDSFDLRKPLPKEWGGLGAEELQKLTGVKTANFCHRNLFLATAGTKEDAIKMVELSLKS